ncbi:MAG: hypothetical protein ACOCXT_03095 [Candidatus Dojkabacteria bacterium]
MQIWDNNLNGITMKMHSISKRNTILIIFCRIVCIAIITSMILLMSKAVIHNQKDIITKQEFINNLATIPLHQSKFANLIEVYNLIRKSKEEIEKNILTTLS